MSDTYRTLCAELVDDLEMSDWPSKLKEVFRADITRARALLAQPVAEGPTVMEIIELHSWLEDEWRANNDGEDLPTLDFARAVLARWGRPTPQPVPYTERLQAVEALAADAVSGLRYIEQTHGRLYGVGWDRVFDAAAKFLPANALPTPEATND